MWSSLRTRGGHSGEEQECGVTEERQEPEPKEEGTESLLRRLGPRASGAATGAAVGTAMAGPIGTVAGSAIGAAVGEGVAEGLDRLIHRVLPVRRRSAERVLEQAATISRAQVGEFVAGIEADDRKTMLAGIVIGAASATVLDEKLRALANALARGATTDDEAEIERERLFVEMLGEIERPHLRVLELMSARYPGGMPAKDWTAPEWERSFLERDLPDIAGVMEPVLATLERHALVERIGTDWAKLIEEQADRLDQSTRGRPSAYGRKPPRPPLRGDPDEWRITAYGKQLLERVKRARAEDDASEPERPQEADR